MATEETIDPFASARQQASDSAAVDAAAITAGQPEDESVVTEIPAQPELAESTNPERVLVEEPSEVVTPTPEVTPTPKA